MAARPLCKIISGIGGRDLQRVQRLAAIYAVAGADWLDVAMDPDVVRAAMDGVDLAGQQGPVSLAIMVSCGISTDPHVGAALLDTAVCATCAGCVIPDLLACAERPLPVRAPECPDCLRCIGACPFGAIRLAPAIDNDLSALQACLLAGASGVEVHVAGARPEQAYAAIASVQAQLRPDDLLSVSVGAEVHALDDLLQIAWQTKQLHRKSWLVQVEGPPMTGDLGAGDTASMALVARVLQADPTLPVQIAGGTGEGTALRCRSAGLHLTGIGFGTTARRLVAPALDVAEFRWSDPVVQAALTAARRLVDSVREAA